MANPPTFKKIVEVRQGWNRRHFDICGWHASGVDIDTHDYIRHPRSFSDMLFELFHERIPYLANPLPDHAHMSDIWEYTEHGGVYRGSMCFEFTWWGDLA